MNTARGTSTAPRAGAHTTTATVHIPAPDGTPLATDLCLPDTPGPTPPS